MVNFIIKKLFELLILIYTSELSILMCFIYENLKLIKRLKVNNFTVFMFDNYRVFTKSFL